MADQITSWFKPFKLGNKVWLEAKNLKLKIPYRKLQPKQEGPFEITKVLSPWTYQLQLPPRWRIHPVFHASLLTCFEQNDTHGPSFLQPPPTVIDNEEEFEVEGIMAHQGKGSCRQYLTKRKGYSTSENSWEPEQQFNNAKQILKAYKDRHKI